VALLRARLYNSLVIKLLIGCSLLYGTFAVISLAVPASTSIPSTSSHYVLHVYEGVLTILFNAVLAVLGFTTLYDAGYKGRRWWQHEGILSVVAVCFAGVVWIVLGVLVTYYAFNDSEWVNGLFIVMLVMGWAGTLVGLVGLHSRLLTRFRKAGWTGFLIALIGTASIPSVLFELLFAAALGGVLVGFLFLGIAALGSRVLPRWCGVALMLAIPASCISGIAAELTLFNQATDEGILFFVVFSLLFGLFWLTLGYVLWSRRSITSDYKTQTRAGQTVATMPNDFPK
jgi:hypothetical protein